MEQFAPQGANYQQSYSLLVNLPDLALENKSVSSVYVYVSLFFRSLCFCLFVGAKVGRKTIAWQEKGNNSFKKLS